MRNPAYRVGVAAKELKISEHHLRRLCEAGLVFAEKSDGGHWQIAIEEINRLKQAGIPKIPTAAGDPSGVPAPWQSAERAASGLSGTPRPSKRVLDAQDDVEIKRQLLELRKTELELAEVEESLSQRDQAKSAILVAEQERKAAEAARVEQEMRYRRWMDAIISYGLAFLPADRSPGLASEAQEVLEGVLSHLDSNRDEGLVRGRVKDEIAQLVAQWRRELKIEKCIQDASKRLSAFAQNCITPTVWEVRARARAAEAVSKLRREAPTEEIIAITQQAGDEVQAEYDAEQRKKHG